MCICVHVYVMHRVFCEECQGDDFVHAPECFLAPWHDSMCLGPSLFVARAINRGKSLFGARAPCYVEFNKHGKSQLHGHEPVWGARAPYFVESKCAN